MGAESQAGSGDPGAGQPRPVTVGVPRETAHGERRVALVPQVVGRLRSRGLTVALLELMLDDTGALLPERIAGEDDEVLVGACVTREGRG